MSAIQSLLRVMTLRDAEAIILETDKVPSLRRRGQIEKLAMPALEAQMLADFVTPLLEGRNAGSLDDGAVQVIFHDSDGASYPVTIDKAAGGLRLVVRPAKLVPKPVRPVTTPGITAEAAARRSEAADRAEAARSEPGPRSDAHPEARPDVRTDERVEVRTSDRGEGRARLAQLLAPFVMVAKERGASDILLSTAMSRFKVAGRLEDTDLHVDEHELAACVTLLGSNTDWSLEIDSAAASGAGGGTRLRVHVFDHLGGHGVAARLIRDRVPTLGELALPPELASVIEQRDGLVLVCGPTGSGKSTTLAALLDLLDQRRAVHVITIEDPIEYRFAPRRGMVHQREVGRHVPSFAVGLRAALREAPDVILLGEMRDPETIAAALTAAETGHLVLATLHAPSAAGAIDRIVDAFSESQQRQVRTQLAGSLRTVITQYLLPRRDGGRAPAIELVPVTPSVANIMRKGDLQMLPSAIQTGRDAGMIPLERSLARLLEQGLVTREAVRAIAADHDLLAALANKLR